MSCATGKALAVGIISGAAISLLATGLFFSLKPKKNVDEKEDNIVIQEQQTEIVDGVDGLIGNTPLMKIKSLSEATGCLVLVCSQQIISINMSNSFLFFFLYSIG
jgi:cysteine synthase A